MTPPEFDNCPEETKYLDFLRPAYYREPVATDNSGGLRSVTTDNNFRPGDTLQTPETIIYRATDYAGLMANCTVTLVPKGMYSISQNIPSLAHLSRRLTGELIVYTGIRRPSVRHPSVVRRSTFSNDISSEAVRRILSVFHI